MRKFLVKVKKRKRVGKLWCGNLVCAATSTLNHQSDLLLNSWESPKMYPPKLYSGPTIQSRSTTRRAAQDLVNEIAQRFQQSLCQISHPLPITRNRLINYSVLCSDSVKKMPQMSQNQHRAPREHQVGRIRVHFRVPCVLEVVNFDTEGKRVNNRALLSKWLKT